MKLKKPKDYTKIFDRVMADYEKARALSLSTSCTASYRGMETLGMGSLGGTSSGSVSPSLSDFICDVELAAKAVLESEEYAHFVLFHLEQSLPASLITDSDHYRRMDRNVIRKAGREFERRRIYPLSIYNKAQEILR